MQTFYLMLLVLNQHYVGILNLRLILNPTFFNIKISIVQIIMHIFQLL